MTIRTRILLGFFAIYITSFYFLFDTLFREIRPRYLETVEDSLNDTVNVLASMMEMEVRNGVIRYSKLDKVFTGAFKRRFDASIYGIKKERVDLQVYVTNKKGVVIYDSDKGRNVGKDFSKWNDVYLTLHGGYGARATRKVKDDPYTSTLFVAAPIRHRDEIVGVITVVKPHDSITPFIRLARRKLIIIGILTCIVLIIMSIILTMWVHRPIVKLTRYVSARLKNRRAKLPKLGTAEIAHLGKTFEELWDTLEGKRYIEKYIQTLTHELKSPLTSIHGAAELLSEEMPEEQRKKFYKNILIETQRIEDVIQKLLELSSLESRKELKDIEEIDGASLVYDILSSLEPQIKRKELMVDIAVEDGIILSGERFLIQQAFRNLIQNAINYSHKKGSIDIYLKNSETGNLFKVKDNGEGIPEYALDRVFDRFYSLPGIERGIKGTGLGLPFAREVAVLHGGSVTVSNNSDGGVTALFALPQ